jgi:hypothetical protein
MLIQLCVIRHTANLSSGRVVGMENAIGVSIIMALLKLYLPGNFIEVLEGHAHALSVVRTAG